MTNLQYIKKPSKRRQAEDAILAENAFRKNKFGEYDLKINPYEEGIRHDRFKRYYDGIHRKYWEYEPIFRDLCEVYGFDPNQNENQKSNN